MSSGKSWGHAITPIIGDSLPVYYRMCHVRTDGKPCGEATHWRTRFAYVTGKGGRIGNSTKFVCDAHAQKFAQRHKLPSPTRLRSVAELDAQHGTDNASALEALGAVRSALKSSGL